MHETPWTQAAVIEGLLHLYPWTGRDYWLGNAVHLGDAQCARQESEGAFAGLGTWTIASLHLSIMRLPIALSCISQMCCATAAIRPDATAT